MALAYTASRGGSSSVADRPTDAAAISAVVMKASQQGKGYRDTFPQRIRYGARKWAT